MYPIIPFLGREISTYALCGIVGVLIAAVLFCRLLVQRGQRDTEGVFLLLVAGAGCLVGSHLLYGLTHIGDWYTITTAASAAEWFSTVGRLFGGGVFYGGLLGGLTAAFLYIKCKKLHRTDYSDCGAVCIPLFHAFARVGCFFAGCCYGIEWDGGFASPFNPYIPDVVGVRRLPVQLIEAVLNVGLFALLFALKNSQRLRGALLYLYLLAYAVLRFSIEILRGDTVRGIWWGVSTSQWISLGLFGLSVCALIRFGMKARRSARTHAL